MCGFGVPVAALVDFLSPMVLSSDSRPVVILHPKSFSPDSNATGMGWGQLWVHVLWPCACMGVMGGAGVGSPAPPTPPIRRSTQREAPASGFLWCGLAMHIFLCRQASHASVP